MRQKIVSLPLSFGFPVGFTAGGGKRFKKSVLAKMNGILGLDHRLMSETWVVSDEEIPGCRASSRLKPKSSEKKVSIKYF